MPAGYPPSAAQQHAQQQHAPLPPTPGYDPTSPVAIARPDRGDELDAGGARTMYEFSGAAAGTPSGDKRTFVGGLDDMPDIEPGDRSERSSNLKSGASSWVLILLGVAVVGGGLTFLTMTKTEPEPEPEPEPVTEPVTPAAGAASAAPATAESAGAASAGEVTPEAAAAEEAKKKAEEEAAAKAAEEEAAKKKAEEEAAAAKKKTVTKKKTPTKKKTVTKKKTPTKVEPDAPTRLTPKKPPRDDGFDALPKPP